MTAMTGVAHASAPLATLHAIPPSLPGEFGRGPLETPLVPVAFGALLLVSLLVVAARRRSGPSRSHPARRVAFALWVLVLAVLTVASSANAYVGYVPTPASLLGYGEGHSSVEVLRVGDARLRVPDSSAYVYLPPGYATGAAHGRRYPVVYLIHGYPGGAIDWFRAGEAPRVMDALLRHHVVPPLILVAPDANGGWVRDSECLDAVHGPQIATFLTGPLVHAVDARYRTVRSRTGRMIGGMSSGGYCALNLGLRHLTTYGAILAFMPFGDPGAVTATVLGGDDRRWLDNAPRYYIPRMPFRPRISTFLAVGAHDPQAAAARALADELRRRHQVVVLRELPGLDHTWYAARQMLPYGLVFAASVLGFRGAPPLPPPGASLRGGTRAGGRGGRGSRVSPAH